MRETIPDTSVGCLEESLISDLGNSSSCFTLGVTVPVGEFLSSHPPTSLRAQQYKVSTEVEIIQSIEWQETRRDLLEPKVSIQLINLSSLLGSRRGGVKCGGSPWSYFCDINEQEWYGGGRKGGKWGQLMETFPAICAVN